MSTETSCHFSNLLQVSKKSLWSLILYTFFMILYMSTEPGQGLKTTWGRNLDVNRNSLSLRSFVASLKKMSMKSNFIQFFHDLIHVYIAQGQGPTAPRGKNFDFNRKTLSLYPFVAKKSLWSLILYIFFHDLIHVYSHRAGGRQLPEDKVLMSTETSCHFNHLLLVSNHRLQ